MEYGWAKFNQAESFSHPSSLYPLSLCRFSLTPTSKHPSKARRASGIISQSLFLLLASRILSKRRSSLRIFLLRLPFILAEQLHSAGRRAEATDDLKQQEYGNHRGVTESKRYFEDADQSVEQWYTAASESCGRSRFLVLHSTKKANLPRLWSLFTPEFRFICLSCAVYLRLSLGCCSIHISGSICFCCIHPDESRWRWVCSCYKEEKKRKFVVKSECFYSVASQDGTTEKFRFRKSKEAGF